MNDVEYTKSPTRVKLTDDEIRALLVKHQHNETLTAKENKDLWTYIANFTRNLERRYFGKQDSSQDLDLHHERIIYVYDYLRERRRFKLEDNCILLETGKMKCRKHWVDSGVKAPPFSMLYKLRVSWAAHEAMIRLAPLGITLDTFDVTGRNKFEFAESGFFRLDVTAVLKTQRLYELYQRDDLINITLSSNPKARRFRKHKVAGKTLGVEPFVDVLLFAVGHRYGYREYDEKQQSYDYFKAPQGTKGRKIWSQNVNNM